MSTIPFSAACAELRQAGIDPRSDDGRFLLTMSDVVTGFDPVTLADDIAAYRARTCRSCEYPLGSEACLDLH